MDLVEPTANENGPEVGWVIDVRKTGPRSNKIKKM
jgi:hypothetical protein